MIELTEQQLQELRTSDTSPPTVLDPKTQETFVLLKLDDYKRLKDEKYDDSDWTHEELEAQAWAAGRVAGWEDMDEYDNLPEKP